MGAGGHRAAEQAGGQGQPRVAAGNGSGGFFAKSVLEPLGADVSGSQFLDPDGKFPNHSPNPEDAEAMDSAVAATVKAKADLGVIFDPDVDRS
ncbi:MAG: hypothetical protein ACO3HA_00830, partial [Burkholderiales bacterium]